MNGSVSLVGAGPGDPDLLTIKAVRAIRRATVLLVDDLVGDGVLRYARKCARIVHVGKRGGCTSTPQAFIERLMIAEAQRGEHVVRLKGGDPFVFGRGGEEVEHLRAAGVNVTVVNGITAGLAATAALGVPWTHRDHARGVMLVTGHAKEGGQVPHWPTLGAAAAQGLTLVVYMGVETLPVLCARLVEHGLAPSTPAATVERATCADARFVVTNLAGRAKILYEKGTKRILGAGIVGVNAGELIAETVLALEMGADAEDIGLTIHPHPTLSETVFFTAEIAEGSITDMMPAKKAG